MQVTRLPWRTCLLGALFNFIQTFPTPFNPSQLHFFSCKRGHHEIIHPSERRAINSILCEKFRPRRFCCGRRSDSIFAQKLCEETYQPSSSWWKSSAYFFRMASFESRHQDGRAPPHTLYRVHAVLFSLLLVWPQQSILSCMVSFSDASTFSDIPFGVTTCC